MAHSSDALRIVGNGAVIAPGIVASAPLGAPASGHAGGGGALGASTAASAAPSIPGNVPSEAPASPGAIGSLGESPHPIATNVARATIPMYRGMAIVILSPAMLSI